MATPWDAEFSPEPLQGQEAGVARAVPHVAPAALPQRPARDGIGVCLYSHDTFGLGHLRRNLAIAEALLRSGENLSVWLLTGSPVVRDWTLPKGLHVQPLPPVVKTGAERYAARKPGQCFGMVKGYREALILKFVMRHRPDCFLVDHAPAGMKGELLPTLALMRRELPGTRIVLGLRDILDSPENVQATWRDQEIHALLEQAYDDILVYGSRALFDVVEGYGIPERVARQVRYSGYVVNGPRADGAAAPPAQVCWDPERAAGRPVVLVTAGGGGDGHFLMEAYLQALEQLPRDRFHSAIVTGPLMPAEQAAALQRAAAGNAAVELVPWTTDLVPSVQAADLVVAMAGYNTTAEIVAGRKRAILVPRTAPRDEQRMRANLLARLGLVWALEPGPDFACRLAQLLPRALEAAPPPESAWSKVDLNGAEQVASFIVSTHMERRNSVAPRRAAGDAVRRPEAVAYILKRYPRLTETFILNEIRAMERLGTNLHVFSLLPPEPPPHHPMVAEVAAPVHTPPPTCAARLLALARAHGAAIAADPWRYARALGCALLWSAQTVTPLSVWRQFIRAGFVAATCRSRGIRRLHAHFANTPAAVAHFTSLMSGIPYSFTAHAKDLYLTPARVIRRRVRSAEFVATCTGYNASHLRSLVDPESAGKIHLVYHGIDLSLFGDGPEAGAKAPRTGAALILSVGRLVPKKGHDDLIAACARLRAEGGRFRCMIVGEGPLRAALQDDIARCGLEEIVTLEGAMTHARLIGIYRQADLFVLAPRIEEDGDRDGIPNVIAEAMAMGVPVVSTDVSGIPELVRHGQTGLLVPSRNPGALAGAMAEVLADPARAAALAQRARALLERDFDLWKTTRRLHRLLDCDGSDPVGSPMAEFPA